MTHENKIHIDKEKDLVEVTISLPTEVYLEQLSNRKILNNKSLKEVSDRLDHVKNVLVEKLNSFKLAEKSIENEMQLFLKGRKTVIKKRIKNNEELNNLLSIAFPKEFKMIEAKLEETQAEIQNIVVEESPTEDDK